MQMFYYFSFFRPLFEILGDLWSISSLLVVKFKSYYVYDKHGGNIGVMVISFHATGAVA